ncbi:UNVERIFIED_ORG: hypothetical protein ABIB19_003787 [Arthrobacter sp. UYEF10]
MSPLGALAAWVLFLPAALMARRMPARHAATVVLLGSVLLGTAAISAPPATSNDSARYAWDGIVQKAGMSPYRYVPADEALRQLRPEWLFQDAGPDGTCHTNPFSSGTETTTNIPGGGTLCTGINRPSVPTVYPAVAELYFLAVRLLPGAEVGFIAFQLVGLLLGLAVYVWRTTNASRPWDGQVFKVGGTLLLVSPSYPWYALPLLPFVVLSRRYEFTAIAPVLAMMYFTGAEPYGQQQQGMRYVRGALPSRRGWWWRAGRPRRFG